MRQKSNATEFFEQSPMDSRADGVPSTVVIVRSDGGGESRGGNVGNLSRSRGIKQEFTTADSPQFNGVAERALGLIRDGRNGGRNPGSIAFSRRATPGHGVVVGGGVPLGV